MIYGIGTDIIEIYRIEKGMKRDFFLRKLFTKDEIAMMKKRDFQPHVVAGNFAAKEAVVKALGVGFSKFSITDIEILRNDKGQPYLKCIGKAEQFIKSNQISRVHISISHGEDYATAMAVAEQEV